ncbi:MAG: PEP-CTERM sorting domain-containing protein [Gammaproteobacteria bacterium]|nr:PEP-CTERM sorting domain-containing protein [Gammaproteobacteria bacterium]
MPVPEFSRKGDIASEAFLSVAAVPEPSTWLLTLAGLVAAVGLRRWRSENKNQSDSTGLVFTPP